jgi:magnesium transporter
MIEIVEGLGARERGRIAGLLEREHFFWADIALGQTSREGLREAFDIPEDLLQRLLDFDDTRPPSRKFRADGEHVVFTFSCFLAPEVPGGEDSSYRPIEVHVLVTGGYMLTLHQEPLSLPDLLELELPEGRTEKYEVYAILEAMVATAFDALNEVALTLESLQLMSADMRAARVRMATLRMMNARLSGMRRRLAPQRGNFERISEEIGRVEGLQADPDPYFDRIGNQLNRLIDGIDATTAAMAQLINLRVNETMYWLTAVATIFLPLTFVTGFFGMNFGWMVKEISSEATFVVLGIGLQVAAVTLTMWLVRRRATPIEGDRRSRVRA